MKKKLSKVLAVVLSLVMVAGLATVDASTAQAAKKAKKLSIVSTGKKNVKSGQKRTIKIKGTNAKKAKWSVSGTGKSYIKLAKKKGKKVSFTVKANATGKAKITAKLTKKNKVSYTYKLSCVATAIALEGKDVYTGVVENLALSVTPSNAKLNADVVYGVFSDETAETATTDAVVTAGAMGCEFYTAKVGTYYVKATAGEMVSIAKVNATEKVAKLQSVVQTKANELAVTFDSDASKVIADDIEIKNGNGIVITANTVTVDKDDNTKATITTFSNMTDAKTNTISYKGGDVLEFQASNGEVVSIEITPATAPINTAVEVKAFALDANKVELASFVYGKEDTNKYVFEVTSDAGSADYTTGKLTMEEIGKTATATCTYDTGKLDASNQPITVVGKQTITAVAEGNITGAEKVKFFKLSEAPADGTSYDDLLKSNEGDAKDKVRVLNEDQQDKSFFLSVVVKDENGYEKVNGSLTEAGYVLESSAPRIFVIDGDEIVAGNAGSASVIVRDENGNVKFTIPVQVEAASKLTKIDTSEVIMKLSTGDTRLPDAGTAKPMSKDFKITALDQYGDEYGSIDITATPTKENHALLKIEDKDADAKVSVSVTTVVKCTGGALTHEKPTSGDPVEGQDYLGTGKTVRTPVTIEVKDTQDDSIKLTKSVYIDLSRPADHGKKVALEVDSATVDTALVDKEAKEKTVNIKLAVLDKNGVFVKYDNIPSGATVEYLKGGKAIGNSNVATGVAINAATGEINSNKPAAGKFGIVAKDGDSDQDVISAAGGKRLIVFSASKTESTSGYTGEADKAASMKGANAASLSSVNIRIDVITRADNARYGVRVNKLAVMESGVVTAGGTLSTITNFSVENTQKDITVQLNKRYGLDGDIETVAAKAFSVTAPDARNYVYSSDKEDELPPFVFAIAKNGAYFNTKSNKFIFNKIEIYVPYRTTKTADTPVIYNKVTKSVSGVVTPEEE